MANEKDLNNQDLRSSDDNPLPKNSAVFETAPSSAPTSSESLIPESMRKLDAILKEIKLQKDHPILNPACKDAVPGKPADDLGPP